MRRIARGAARKQRQQPGFYVPFLFARRTVRCSAESQVRRAPLCAPPPPPPRSWRALAQCSPSRFRLCVAAPRRAASRHVVVVWGFLSVYLLVRPCAALRVTRGVRKVRIFCPSLKRISSISGPLCSFHRQCFVTLVFFVSFFFFFSKKSAKCVVFSTTSGKRGRPRG